MWSRKKPEDPYEGFYFNDLKGKHCLFPLGFEKLCAGKKDQPETHHPRCINYNQEDI